MKYLLILSTVVSFGQFNPIFQAHNTSTYTGFLDAANVSSYPGSGTTWTNLKSLRNCTLVGGTTFDSNNGGSIQFDGVNDYGNMGSAYNYTTHNFSFSVWTYITSLTTTSAGQGPVLFFKGTFGTSGYYCQIETTGRIIFTTNQPTAVISRTTAGDIVAGNWYNITVTKNGTSVKIYVNGIDKTAIAGSHGDIISSVENFALGAYWPPNTAPSGIFSNIRIAKFQAYTKGLSASEVTDNFNTYKSIYGL